MELEGFPDTESGEVAMKITRDKFSEAQQGDDSFQTVLEIMSKKAGSTKGMMGSYSEKSRARKMFSKSFYKSSSDYEY